MALTVEQKGGNCQTWLPGCSHTDMAARLLSQVDSTTTHHPGQDAPGKPRQLLPASYERIPGSHASLPGTEKGFGPLGKSLT